ncbi:MAG: efflux RND transporter periplasmic adaptor subunit [Candidatus Aminicenantes bacterium]|nr:MAG: efflux RND transporter periplasmic adaptor subunit [Candidatus Aminicenantes bacterium]
MKKYIILLSILILASCGGGEKKIASPSNEQGPDTHKHESLKPEESEKEEHEHPELHLPPKKQKEWGIVVGTATKQDIASVITLPGILALNLNKTANISSFVQGKVISMATDLGDRVRKGQVLATINSPEFAQAQAAFLEARAKLNLSRKEYERAKMLFKEKAIEEREFLRREAEFEKLSTEVGGLGSILHSYGMDHDQTEKLVEKSVSMKSDDELCELCNPNLPILSPISGTTIFRDVIVGEHVEPQKNLFTVSDLSILWALLDAYEKDLPFISKKSAVVIKSPLYPEKEFIGKITYISDIIDEKLRTAKIRVEVQNHERLLKPNMYIQGIVENKEAEKKILAIPEEAIQNIDGEKIVFILEEENVFAVHHVELGEKIGSKRIITKGLEEGEIIVIKGAFTLKAELNKATFGHAHVH